VVEVVVADQAAVGLAARRAVFGLVDLLEDGALVPGGALVAAKGPGQFFLRDVEDADFQVLVGLGVRDEVVEAAPGALEAAEILVVRGGGNPRGA